jgi:hypothetical protein
MDIRFENGVKTELFCNVGIGDCFVVDPNTPDQIICMKVYPDTTGKINAVDLEGGELMGFEDDEEVILIDAELKVRLGG